LFSNIIFYAFQTIINRMKTRILTVFAALLLMGGLSIAGNTIIQKGSIVTDVFNATSLFVERISGYQLKGNIDASGNKVTNLAEPINFQDAATKAYVDSKALIGLNCSNLGNEEMNGTPTFCDAKAVYRNPTAKITYPAGVLGSCFAPLAGDSASGDAFCKKIGFNQLAQDPGNTQTLKNVPCVYASSHFSQSGCIAKWSSLENQFVCVQCFWAISQQNQPICPDDTFEIIACK
jgi:hypothetical protein